MSIEDSSSRFPAIPAGPAVLDWGDNARICFCVGGPGCCIKQPQPPPMYVPGPFRCPDCLVWWTGFEHRCARANPWSGNNTVPVANPFPTTTISGG